jgi:hypothetical protein
VELSFSQIMREARQAEALRQADASALTKEAISPELFALTAGDSEDPRFRRITSPSVARDLNPLMQLRMQQVCFYLSVTTPFGKRIVRVMVDYVVGEGFKAVAEDPDVQQLVDRFWNDPANKMDENIESLCQELLVFGELCIPVAVNPVDGFVKLGYIDPQEIEYVEFATMQTQLSDEITMPAAVRLRQRIGEAEGRRLRIIQRDDDPQSPTFGKLTGDCFYFAINKAKAASRGISELFSLADWIDVFDQMVFDFADRVRFLNSFVWHYVVKGATEEQVEALKKKVVKSPPRQGGVQVTNDQVDIEARTPDLKGADMSEAARVVKLYGMGGAGLPAWFFADPVDANRATAEEMAGPTGKMLTNKQNAMKRVVSAIVDFVIDQAKQHGVIAESADARWTLQVPDLSVKDIAASATALQTITTSVAQAEDRGYIRGVTAARAVHALLTQVGVDVDQDEYDMAQKERQERDANQQDALNPQKNLADALQQAQKQTDMVQ